MSFYQVYTDQVDEFDRRMPPPTESLEISEDTIISYDKNGNTASVFSDNTWDFSAIASNQNQYTFDAYIFPESIIKEIKILSYARIYWSPTSRSLSSIRPFPLFTIAKWSVANNRSIQETLNDKKLINWLAASLSSLERREADNIAAVVNELTKIRVAHSSLVIAPASFELAEVLKNVASSIPKKRVKQTPLIPTRIYAALITSIEKYLQEFTYNFDEIKGFYKFAVDGLSNGGELHKSTSGFKRWYKREGNYQAILSSFDLTSLSEKYQLTDKKRWNQYIRNVQHAAKTWIHLFTGMRDQEVNTLNRDCLTNLNVKGSTAKIIRGYTSKTIGSGATSTYWITSKIIDIGIEVARSIGEIAAIQNNWELHSTDYPLFPTIFPLDSSHLSKSFHANAPFSDALSGDRLRDWCALFPEIIVNEEDLAELYTFDGFRDWQSEIQLGKPWPLTTHQCRRSLAVYLACSGLVSLGSLQLQYKHLVIAMTSYYRRNSIFAQNFILNDTEDEAHKGQILFIESLETEEKLSQFFSYEKKVVKQQPKLWGGEGTRIRQAHKTGRTITILNDRDLLKKAFLKGEVSYRPGPMGGCTKVGPCDKSSVTQLGSQCLGCAEFIGDEDSIPKAEKALSLLYKIRNRYPSTSLHYKQTQKDIDIFESRLNIGREAIK